MVVARWVMVVVRCKMMNSWMIFYLTDGKVFLFSVEVYIGRCDCFWPGIAVF